MSHDRLFGLRIGASSIGEEFCRYVVGENAVWKFWICGKSAEKQVECCNDKYITRTAIQRGYIDDENITVGVADNGLRKTGATGVWSVPVTIFKVKFCRSLSKMPWRCMVGERSRSF